MASDIITVRECVGVAFSLAEKIEQSVFLRWDRVAVSLSRWWPVCHYHPLAVASFGGAIVTGQWLRWRSRREYRTHRATAGFIVNGNPLTAEALLIARRRQCGAGAPSSGTAMRVRPML